MIEFHQDFMVLLNIKENNLKYTFINTRYVKLNVIFLRLDICRYSNSSRYADAPMFRIFRAIIKWCLERS